MRDPLAEHHPTGDSHQPESLKRDLSRLSLLVLALNGSIGAGIFGLPSEAARLAGWFSPMMFVFCGALAAAIILSLCEAAGYFDSTGGPILYTRTAFGPFVGFETGWVLYLGRVTAAAANANLLVTYLATFWPKADQGPYRIGLICLVLGFFAAINVVGIRRAMEVINTVTVLKFLPFIAFLLAGIGYLGGFRLGEVRLPGAANFGEAALLLFYAFVGFEGALVPAAESRDPKRDIPRALLTGVVLTTALYVAVQIVCLAVVPNLAATKRPLADAATIIAGNLGAAIIVIGASVSIFGNVASILVVAPRMTYALALDRQLPKAFAAVSATSRTPNFSIVFSAVLIFALTVSGSFKSLAGMSSLTRILGYAACVAALPFLRKTFRIEKPGLFQGYVVPITALVVCGWLLIQVKADALGVTAAFLAAGAVLYFIGRRK